MPSVYFPALDKCLAGGERLISWKVAYRTLCNPARAVEERVLEAFLTDTESVKYLTTALDPFPAPSPKTKSEFETKTAPINVSQSHSGVYDLEDIKKDAQWLSQHLNVDELVALRVVILEWQSRAEDALRSDVAGKSSAKIASNAVAADFSKEESRRARQLEVYLEEQSHILRTTAWLVEKVAVQDRNSRKGRTWLDELSEKITEDTCSLQTPSAHDSFCASCIETIDGLILKLSDSSKWPEPFRREDNRQLLYVASTVQRIVLALRLLLANVYMLEGVPSATLVSSWFTLMARINFFQDLAPSPAIPNVANLESLVSVISLSILRLPEVMNRMQELAVPALEGAVRYPQLPDSSYIRNEACIKEVNLALHRAAEDNLSLAGPAIYAWSIITTVIRDMAKMQQEMREQRRLDDGSDDGELSNRRRASRRDSKEEMSAVENQYWTIQDFALDAEVRMDPPSFLARAAVDKMGVYSTIAQLSETVSEIFDLDSPVSFVARLTLFDLVREGMAMVSYGSEVLAAALALLKPTHDGTSCEYDSRLADRFLSDEHVFRPSVLDQAISRYPFELSPLLNLFAALSATTTKRAKSNPVMVHMLENLQTMTVMVPDHFRSYVLDHEDENTNSMSLTDTLPLFASKQALAVLGNQYHGHRLLPYRSESIEESRVFAIPPGAPGIIVKESRPLVFCLEHPHSGLEYLGSLLSTLLSNTDVVVAPMNTHLDRSTAAEIIALINALLAACMRQPHGPEEAQFVLGRLAYALQDEQDIVSIIADILENELLAHLDQSIQEGSLELLVASARFFDQLTAISPERVWSMLARSSLLGLNGGANSIAAVVGASEVTSGRFGFLGACVSIYSHLISDAITGLARRKTKPNRVTNRFDSPLSFQDSTPERTMSTVLQAYQITIIDAWQSLTDWRFASPAEKCEINTAILQTFDQVLRSTYGLESGAQGISSLLFPSATALLNALVPESLAGAMIQPFSSLFSSGGPLHDEFLSSYHRSSLVKDVITAADFLTTVMRTVRLVDPTHARPDLLAAELLRCMPSFADLLTTDHTFKGPLFALLTEIATNLDGHDAECPSILEYLTTEAAKSFLSVIGQLDRPICDIEVESTMWSFLSAVMSSKQQWFAIYLLTGALPRDRLKDGKEKTTSTKSKSLLSSALDELSNIANLEPERAMAMLQFVASAQNTWVWATHEVRSHSDFLKNALEWLRELQVPARTPNIAEEMLLAYESTMAAYLCDILAVNLHASNEVGDKTLIKLLPSKLAFLRQHGVAVNAYNRSLHRNLAENFARKFPACSLDDFERTTANPSVPGRKYLYDTDLANDILGYETAWSGAANGRQQGFVDEFARANVNTSLVDAQTRLLKSWRVLATVLCECVEQDAVLQGDLAKTAERCLRSNVEANLEQPGMDEVVKIRAEMAFVIISKLTDIKSTDAAMKSLLPAAWNLLSSSPVDYDVASSPGDLVYYRTLLQVLYLAIQPHIYMAADSKSSTQTSSVTSETKIDFIDAALAACLVQIMTKVVAPGFRALCGNLHNDIRLAEPRDFALITALVQGILSVPGVSAVHQQLADVVVNTSIVRGALSLYSWSDRLAEVTDEDPVYGEVAITFLLSLSTMRPVAEQMALDGILVQLSAANLSDYYRKQGGKTPFSEPKRMFVIWTEGLLPLCLNLLDTVGPPIAGEVAIFLNSFPQQLVRASTSLENREATRQNPFAGSITLGLVAEAHSLCLIALILASDTARGAAEGIDAADVPALEYDYEKVVEDAAGLTRQRTSLASRIVAVSQREEGWAANAAGMSGDSELFTRILNEVKGLLKCFGKET